MALRSSKKNFAPSTSSQCCVNVEKDNFTGIPGNDAGLLQFAAENECIPACYLQGSDAERKPRMEMVYESGWLKLFDQYDTQDLPDTLWASILCAVCFSGLFAMERQTGDDQSHRHNTAWTACHRAVQAVAFFTVCGLITVLSLLPRFWVSIRDYGLGTWMAPVYSISEYYNAPEILCF